MEEQGQKSCVAGSIPALYAGDVQYGHHNSSWQSSTQQSESFLLLVRHRDWWGRVATQAVTRNGPSGVKRGEPYRGSEALGEWFTLLWM